MTVALFVDAQLPPRLAPLLSARGHGGHVADIGLLTPPDTAIWNAAIERAAILMTKDQDFACCPGGDGEGPAIIWVQDR